MGAGVGGTEGSRVLVVEDDPAVRTALTALLERSFQVNAVDSVLEAERALDNGQFDVVLTDYEMPGGSGMELLRWMSSRHPSSMGILLTGYPDHPEVLAAEREQVVVRVIAKPYDADRLLRWVENTVKLVRMRRAVTRMVERPPRYNFVLKVAYPPLPGEREDVVTNLSLGGLFLRTDRTLELGQRVDLQLSFPGLLEGFDVEAEVRWARPADAPEGGGYGIAFRNLNADVQARIATLIDEWSGKTPVRRSVEVLVLEPLGLLQRLYAKHLTGQPHEPVLEWTTQVEKCLEQLRRRRFTALVVDVDGLPMHLPELLSLVRTHAHGEQLPVVVLHSQPTVNLPKGDGLVTSTQKPIAFESLVKTLGVLRGTRG